MTRSFGLDAISALEALRTAVKCLNDDALNADLARECACKAWHLCDHAFKALEPNSPFASLQKLQERARGTCPALACLQDICIESKHAEITRHSPHIREARNHSGDFCREDFSSEDFDTARLEVELLDGRTVSFEDLVSQAVDFWSDFFESHALT